MVRIVTIVTLVTLVTAMTVIRPLWKSSVYKSSRVLVDSKNKVSSLGKVTEVTVV